MALSMGQTAGSPYVTLTKTGTNGIFDVTRTVAGVVTPVRGTLTVAAGTGALVDREAPQGTLVQYNAGADSTSGTTNVVGTYLIHPTNSALDVKVVVESYPAWTRPVAQEVFRPLGASTPIVVSGKRGKREGSGFRVVCEGDTATNALAAILESSRVLLLSTADYPAGYMWVAVGEESWQWVSHGRTDTLWRVDLPLTEIARPEVTTSGRVTWLDVAARYPTCTDLHARYGTWEAFLADVPNWTT